MSKVTPAIRRCMWEEMQEALKNELGDENANPTVQGPQPVISYFSNFDLLPAKHLQNYWINAGIPLLKVSISSDFTIEQARERGEVFGALFGINVDEYVNILNAYADSCGSPNPPMTAETFRAKRINDFLALEGVDAAALAKKKLGWTHAITKAFFQGAKEAFQLN